MTILFDPSRNVKPATPAAFASGILAPARRGRFAPTPADREWAASTSPTVDEGYEVIFSGPAPISGGAPTDADYDRMAGEALALDRHERGLILI